MRRKVFRIEQAVGGESAKSSPGDPVPSHDLMAELKALRELIDRGTAEHASSALRHAESVALRKLREETGLIHQAINRNRHEIGTLYVDAVGDGPTAHVARELDAVVGGAERSIQLILAAAEDIDEAANTLTASLKNEQDHCLAKDIREDVVRVFEACNFHDLAGQRIAKVLMTLRFVEERIARMMDIWGGIDAAPRETDAAEPLTGGKMLIHGPKNDGDPGHASQNDIDALFTEVSPVA